MKHKKMKIRSKVKAPPTKVHPDKKKKKNKYICRDDDVLKPSFYRGKPFTMPFNLDED